VEKETKPAPIGGAMSDNRVANAAPAPSPAEIALATANEKIAKLEAEKAEAEAVLAAKKGILLPVRGTVKVVQRANGKESTVSVKLKAGNPNLRGENAQIFPSEHLFKVANSETLSEAVLKEYPQFESMTAAKATTIFQNLMDMGYAQLEIVK
jgi:hypothetical protein